jgi:hypothetical protein
MSSTNNADNLTPQLKCERAVRLMNSRRRFNQKQAAAEVGVSTSLLRRFKVVTKFNEISTFI